MLQKCAQKLDVSRKDGKRETLSAGFFLQTESLQSRQSE
jgi:hypothetical protein